MGINNLNNQANFGKLTTGNVQNDNNKPQVQVNANANTKKSEVLNSATLKEGQGTKFDSDTYGNEPSCASAKGNGKKGLTDRERGYLKEMQDNGWKDQDWAAGAAICFIASRIYHWIKGD